MKSPKIDILQNTCLQYEQQIKDSSQFIQQIGYQRRAQVQLNDSGLFQKIRQKISHIQLSKALAFIIIIVFVIFISFQQSSTKSDSYNTERKVVENSVINQNKITNKYSQQTGQKDEQFGLQVVQTQFQGKITEQMLAKAGLQEMQKKFNLHHYRSSSAMDDQMNRQKLLIDISNLQSMIPDKKVHNYKAQNYYFFSASIHEMILNSNLDQLYRNGQTIFKISLKQHLRAIIRTQLVHNINSHGNIEVTLSPFDKSIQQKQTAILQIMRDQQQYYEQFYQLSKYNNHQLRFCLVIPSYNNYKSRLYLRNLDSLFMQDYQNYHIVYIDDASPDKTGDHVKKYIIQNKIPHDKIEVFINPTNKKAMENIYNYIHNHCPNGEIVGLIDGDDSLLGRKVLQLYNAVYQQKRAALIYSNFLKILTNNKTSFGFGTEITKQSFQAGTMRNSMYLVGSHFMSFFADIFKKIRKQDLCYDNGTFYDYAYDRAIITPMVEMAYPRVEYLAQVTYEYRNDTGINDGTQNWQRVSRIILAKDAYESLQQFPFIDNFVEQAEYENNQEQKSLSLQIEDTQINSNKNKQNFNDQKQQIKQIGGQIIKNGQKKQFINPIDRDQNIKQRKTMY